MKRLIDHELNKWKVESYRKPLIMRGARQVGKTHAIRQFGKHFVHFIEVNFERSPQYCEIFNKDLDPIRISNALAMESNIPIVPKDTLLFFDEIQACPEALIALRYFYEEMPELHLIAAGSLLDFAIEQVGIPVGRVSYCYMYPLSFIEFLIAGNHSMLCEKILNQSVTEPIETILHEKLFGLLGQYILLGGMPEVCQRWFSENDALACVKSHDAILNTYRDDFPKYAKKLQIKYLDILFDHIPHVISKQFIYSKVDGNFQKRELAPALNLLLKAGVVHKIEKTAGNGFPLGAEVDSEKYKCLFLDVGLTQTLLGSDDTNWLVDPMKHFVNKGALTEALVGQELIAYSSPIRQEHLYYWRRESRGSSAEIDYLCKLGSHIIPIEVKSGKGTTLKSLHRFINDHAHSPYGIRLSIHNYSRYENLDSYPIYAIVSLLAQHDESLRERIQSLL